MEENEEQRYSQLAAEFRARRAAQTPEIRERFANAIVDGKRVLEVGDIVWWPRIDRTIVLGSVKFHDGTCAVVGLEEDGTFVIPEAGRLSWPTRNLKAMPRLELGDDHIAVWFTDERYLMVGHEYVSPYVYRWKFTGIGSSGAIALREFAKHGMTFSAEQGK